VRSKSCAQVCPNGAIEVVIEDDDFINKTIEKMKKATI